MPQIPILSFSFSDKTSSAILDVTLGSIVAFVAPVLIGPPVRLCDDVLDNEMKRQAVWNF